jgi:hypothetical protein
MAGKKSSNRRPLPPDGPTFRPWTDTTPDPYSGIPSDPNKPQRQTPPGGVLRPERPTPPKRSSAMSEISDTASKVTSKHNDSLSGLTSEYGTKSLLKGMLKFLR